LQQTLMRHADIRTTMNQYCETPTENRREANSKVMKIVFDRRSSSGDWSPKAESSAVGTRKSDGSGNGLSLPNGCGGLQRLEFARGRLREITG
jgi:hypothetical protein